MSRDDGRPLIIGESPSKAGDRYYQFPLSGRPAEFLCQLARLEHDGGAWYWTLIEHFATANAVERWPGKTWPTEVARERVAKIVRGYDVVVLMGKRAQVAYPSPLVARAPFFEWNRDVFGERDVVAIPHSSGLNRLYNDAQVRESAARALREALDKAKLHEPPVVAREDPYGA